jgi:hypothetical protein
LIVDHRCGMPINFHFALPVAMTRAALWTALTMRT